MNINKLLSVIIGASCTLSCSSPEFIDGYKGLEHRDSGSTAELPLPVIDTIAMPAASTSMSGQWLLRGDTLLFVDKYSVGVRSYDLNGNFLKENICHGRGPDEMLEPAFASSIDPDTGDIAFHTGDSFIYVFNRDFIRTTAVETPWFQSLVTSDIYALMEHPDPENDMMYEYRHEFGSIHYQGGRLTIPVITDHVQYNGYDKADYTKDFWRRSYILMSMEPVDIPGTVRKFGHFPPVYRDRNIPIFSAMDFAVAEDKIYVTFAADARIYVMDMNGQLLYSTGTADPDIRGEYPETRTLSQFEQYRLIQLAQYGHYRKLSFCNGYLIRTLWTDSHVHKLQVYRDDRLEGIYSLPKDCEIIGEHDGIFYAALPVDTDNEQFRIIRFRL